MRKYLRSIARHNMKRAGIQKVNKRPWGVKPGGLIPTRLPSYFSENWRAWV